MPIFAPGSLIADEYRVERLLGQGGMAVVYLCQDMGLGRQVAVKVMNDQLLLVPDALGRFAQEARTMARLDHPNVMAVLRVVQRPDLVAIVMPYYPGESLADRLDRSPGQALPEPEALGVFAHVVAGVRAAHESVPQVIHRDIKPDNIYLADVRGEPSALLMDFGIAKVLQDGRLRTQTGARMGTVAYMAPEQIQATKDAGPTADVFSLGVVLYEMLCGQRPFVSDSDLMLPGVVVAAQVPAGPLRGVRAELREVILRCLQKEAGARYSSVAELQRAVFQGGGEPPSPPPPPPPQPVPGQGRRMMLLAGLALLLALGAVGSWLALRPGGRRETAVAPVVEPRTSAPPVEAVAAPAAATPALPAPPRTEPAAGPWGIEWVVLPGGSFAMGSDSGDSRQKPAHQVQVAPFAMMRSEVTVGMFRACVARGHCEEPHFDDGSCNVWNGGMWKKGVLLQSFRQDAQPVVCVEWSQAVAFCSAAGGRLPREAEWEYAASGGEGRKYPWGSEEATCARAVMDDGGIGCGEERPWPVCSKRAGASKHGLCDLAGNVAEWTQDCWHGSYWAAPTDGSAWTTACKLGDVRVVRGGSWYLTADRLWSTSRIWSDADRGSANDGFRCVRPTPPRG